MTVCDCAEIHCILLRNLMGTGFAATAPYECAWISKTVKMLACDTCKNSIFWDVQVITIADYCALELILWASRSENYHILRDFYGSFYLNDIYFTAESVKLQLSHFIYMVGIIRHFVPIFLNSYEFIFFIAFTKFIYFLCVVLYTSFGISSKMVCCSILLTIHQLLLNKSTRYRVFLEQMGC
jgi:hypothetical protein